MTTAMHSTWIEEPFALRGVDFRALLDDALKNHYTDLHLEAHLEGVLQIRARLRGRLEPLRFLEKAQASMLLNQIKHAMQLPVGRSQSPQDGRMQHNGVDFRVSLVPVPHGESVVIRVLSQSNLRIETLMPDVALRKKVQDCLTHKDGFFLIVGPTGSGKTTTLNCLIRSFFGQRHRILSIEDPVEYRIPGVTQVQVNMRLGLGFEAALKAFLRHDPDLLFVGEIRSQSALMDSLNAALSGRLVLSTLHAPDSLAALKRMEMMGAPKDLIAASLRGILAQRLSYGNPTQGSDSSNGITGLTQASFEFLDVTPDLAFAIESGASEKALIQTAALDRSTA